MGQTFPPPSCKLQEDGTLPLSFLLWTLGVWLIRSSKNGNFPDNERKIAQTGLDETTQLRDTAPWTWHVPENQPCSGASCHRCRCLKEQGAHRNAWRNCAADSQGRPV